MSYTKIDPVPDACPDHADRSLLASLDPNPAVIKAQGELLQKMLLCPACWSRCEKDFYPILTKMGFSVQSQLAYRNSMLSRLT